MPRHQEGVLILASVLQQNTCQTKNLELFSTTSCEKSLVFICMLKNIFRNVLSGNCCWYDEMSCQDGLAGLLLILLCINFRR